MTRFNWAGCVGRFVRQWNGLSRASAMALPRGMPHRCGGSHWAALDPLEPRCLMAAAFDLIGVNQLRADPAFAGIDGSGVSVAVIDTGVDFTHPLLQPGFIAGADIVFGGNVPTPVDDHGSHVAGIVGARDLNIGVAPGVGLIGLQVFTPSNNGRPLAYQTHTERALAWVLEHRAEFNIVAVNMSLGGGNFTSIDQVAGDILIDDVQRLEAAGVTVVSAAGNGFADDQTPGSGSPAIFSTLNVGAVYEENEGPIGGGGGQDNTTGPDRVTFFSQRPSTNNVVFAPGAMILSTIPGNQFQEMPGTSMASPMVAGVVALMQEAAQQFGGRLLTPVEVRQVIQQTADNVNDGDDEDTNVRTTGGNYPRVNAYRALQFIRQAFAGGPGPDPGPGPGPDPDPVDPNGTIASAIAGPSLAGAAVEGMEGVIGSDGSSTIGPKDVDLVRFEVLAPGTVTVTATKDGGSLDAFLRVFDAAGTQIAFDDDSLGNLNARVTMALGTGTYYAGVSGASNSTYNPSVAGSGVDGSTGAYVLNFGLSSADPNGLLSGAVPIGLGGAQGEQVLPGFIGADFGAAVGSSDVDIFRIVVPDNGTLFLDIDTPDDNGFVDSVLRIFDEAGNEVTTSSDDDLAPDELIDPDDSTIVTDEFGNPVGHRTDSYVDGTVARGDVYYIAISDFNNRFYNPSTLSGRPATGPGGTYELHVTFVNNDLNGSINQALTATSLPFSAAGVLGSDPLPSGDLHEVGDRDVDFVRVNSPVPGILQAVVASTTVPENTSKVDTVLRLFDADGTLLTFDDDTNGLDPEIRFEIDAGVDYFIAVAGFGNNNFDPFVLGSGSPGETGLYGFAVDVLPLAEKIRLTDDTADSGGVVNVALGFRRGGVVGEDRGFARRQTDVDLYRFVADGAGTVEIVAMPGTDFGADPFLRLFDANLNEIAFDDNSVGLSRGARIATTVTPGTYYIGVSGAGTAARSYDPRTGAGAAVGSTGEYTLSVTGALGPTDAPDLRVAAVVPRIKPGAVIGGRTKGTALVRVVNDGSQPSAGFASTRLVLSTDGEISDNDTTLAVLPPKMLRLRPGAGKNIKAKFIIPAIADGNYFLLAETDFGKSILERSESNNVGSSAAAIPIAAPFLDLSASFGQAPTSLVAGQRVQITLMVRNDGNVPAKGVMPVRLLASLDGALSGDDSLLVSLPAVKVNVKQGATKAVKLKFTVPSGITAGSYFYIASIDNTPLLDRNLSNNVAVSPGQFVLG